MAQPVSLSRGISPPPTRKVPGAEPDTKVRESTRAVSSVHDGIDTGLDAGPSLAAIEAGEAQIRDHLAYFVRHLSSALRDTPPSVPRLPIDRFRSLYEQNQHPHGRHFVIHQHDHPISGVHYDLRLQFSETSTVSFAVPYGLPGNPNSIRPHRMAIETRVHNLWNNLIESASHSTGSLLIWDTGEYEVLPYRDLPKEEATDDELSDCDQYNTDISTDRERLVAGFQDRHLRLRLRGSKLPANYTIGLRLPSANDAGVQPPKPKRKRRRTEPTKTKSTIPSSDTDDENLETSKPDPDEDAALASEADDEDETIRENNAYTGAVNSIGSIHQRHWFLTLDKARSGFQRARDGRWEGIWEPFFVMGRDIERSVVTGRTADEVVADERVSRFVGRKMWRPITE